MAESAGDATAVQRVELKKRPCIEKATPWALSSVGKISDV
jgi:hypothetical protein